MNSLIGTPKLVYVSRVFVFYANLIYLLPSSFLPDHIYRLGRSDQGSRIYCPRIRVNFYSKQKKPEGGYSLNDKKLFVKPFF